jgi:hypothetical protein
VRKLLFLLVILALSASPVSAAKGMTCTVGSPIYASELNSGGTWYFEVFGAEPNTNYSAMVTWAADPSNGGHFNAGVVTDSSGYGKTVMPAWWSPDGFLPGHMEGGTFVAEPGEFKLRVGPKTLDGKRAGSANCSGVVLP